MALSIWRWVKQKVTEIHVLIWFEASTVTGQIITQLAKLGGLKVVGVADLSKHRQLLQSLGTGRLAYGIATEALTYIYRRHSS